MGIGCSQYSFHRIIREGQMNLEEFVKTCNEIGIQELELLDMFLESADASYIDKVKELLSGAGCRTVCVTLHPKLLLDDEAERQAQIEYVKRWLDAASRLGAGVIRVNLSGTQDVELATQRAIEALKPISAHAATLDIKVTLENHGGPTRTAEGILRILEGVGADNLGALPDFGNFDPETRYQQVEKVAKYAFHCHAKTRTFNQEGEEVGWDTGRCIRIMKEAGYTGCWGIEFEGKFDELTPNELEGVKKSKALLEKYV